MAAFDRYRNVVGTLSERERELLKDVIQREWEELLAARSEEARVRLVDEFIDEIHEPSRGVKH